MYYKITHGGDVMLADHIDYIREQANGTVVRCKPENANGITLGGEASRTVRSRWPEPTTSP